MGVRIPQTWSRLYPVGEYAATITAIKEKEGQFGPQLQFTFMLDVAREQENPLLGWTSAIFSARSKLYKWVKAAFGGSQLSREYTFDSDDVIGKKVLLTLVVRERDDGSSFNTIDSLRAAQQEIAPLFIPEADIPF